MSHEPAAIPHPSQATGDIACLRCGYSLMGLPTAGQCPECGTPIEHSMRGTLLEYSSPEYLATIHRGVFLVLAAIIGQILLLIASVLSLAVLSGLSVRPSGFAVLSSLASVGLSLLLLLGWWQLSAPDPASAALNKGEGPRRTVRALVICAAATRLATLLVGTILVSAPGAQLVLSGVLGVFGFIVFAARFFAEMLYIRWLAPRIPDQRVYRRASTLLWAGPLLVTVGIVLLGLGPVIALVLYWNMLDWVRRDLKAIRLRAAYYS